MMSFYRRGVSSWLGTLATTTTSEDSLPPSPLIQPTPHPAVYSPSSPPRRPPPAATSKKAGGTGYLHDQMGGSSVTNGLTSCTESLGFESSDETTLDSAGDSSCTDDARSLLTNGGGAEKGCAIITEKPRTVGEEAGATAAKKELMTTRKKIFPPPLSFLNSKGQRNFVLRSVRRDGRLEIINEVTIRSPSETMFATRQDGRLRLHLIRTVDDNIDDEEEETETEAGKKELVSQKICTTAERQQQEEELTAEDVKDENNLTNEENHHEGEGEDEEEQEEVAVKTVTSVTGDGGEWKLCDDGGGDGARRCYSSYFEKMHLWTRPCVITS